MHERQARLEADVIGSSDNTAGLMVRGLALVVAALSVIKPCAAQIPCYEISAVIQGPSCGILGDSITVGTAINSHGHVTGYWNCPGGGAYRPFIWTPETGLVTLTLPPWLLEAIPSDINDNGWICGTGVGPVTGQVGWVRTDAGEWIELQSLSPPNGRSGANAINNNNVVCGFRSIDDGGDPTYPWTAFIWAQDKGFTDLGLINAHATSAADINDAGVTTGSMTVGNALHTFFWFDRSVIDLGMPQGASNSEGYALNDFNQVTGRSEFPIDDFPFFTNRAYFGDQNGLIDCGTLPGQSLSLPSDVSNDGIVVGTSRTLLQNDDRAFMWRDGEMHDLNELTELPAKWILVGAAAINKRQQIVAVVETAESEIATVLTSAVLAGIGDVDENCRVDIDDLLQVINHWGQIESPADINRDGIVNVHDLVIVLSNWTM